MTPLLLLLLVVVGLGHLGLLVAFGSSRPVLLGLAGIDLVLVALAIRAVTRRRRS